MAKTFLEQARELEATDREYETDSDLVNDHRYIRLARVLRMQCWPEILTVVEAAERHAAIHGKDGSDCDELADALDALDIKAGE